MNNSFFAALTLLVTGLHSCTSGASESSLHSHSNPVVETVQGPLPADSLGTVLIHEHVFLDWTPAMEQDSSLWQTDSAYAAILPHLYQLKDAGVTTFMECTPAFLGRNPRLLRRLAKKTGLHIITNTGYYGARDDQHLPGHAFNESADQLAARWIQEYQDGIDGTGVRPGFIKIGVDGSDTLSVMDEKLVRAAARTHLATGLTIVAHTGPDAPARREVAILEEEGLSPEAWVWTHAQNGTSQTHVELARKGAWISLDGMGWIAPAEGDSSALLHYLDMLENMKENHLLHRILLSHDAGWYTHGEPGGGAYTEHTLLFNLVIPALKKRGFTEADIDQLLRENPKAAYTIRVRRQKGAKTKAQ